MRPVFPRSSFHRRTEGENELESRFFPPRIFRSERGLSPGLTPEIHGTNIFVLLQQSNKELKKGRGEKEKKPSKLDFRKRSFWTENMGKIEIEYPLSKS